MRELAENSEILNAVDVVNLVNIREREAEQQSKGAVTTVRIP